MWTRTVGTVCFLLSVGTLCEERRSYLAQGETPCRGRGNLCVPLGESKTPADQSGKTGNTGSENRPPGERGKKDMNLIYLTNNILILILSQSQQGLSTCHSLSDFVDTTDISAECLVGLEAKVHRQLLEVLMDYLVYILAYIQAALNTGHWITQQIYEQLETLIATLECFGVDIVDLDDSFVDQVMELAEQIAEQLWGFTTGNSRECIPSKPSMMTGLSKDALHTELSLVLHHLVSEHISKYVQQHPEAAVANLVVSDALHAWEKNMVDCTLKPANASLILLNRVTGMFINNEVRAMNFLLQEIFDVMTTVVRVIPEEVTRNVTAILDSIPKNSVTGHVELQTCQRPSPAGRGGASPAP